MPSRLDAELRIRSTLPDFITNKLAHVAVNDSSNIMEEDNLNEWIRI